MKHVKKLLAVVLSAALAMSMCVCAFADNETGTFTIGNTSEADNRTYDVYQVFTSRVSKDASDEDQYVYTVNPAFKNFFNGNPYKLNANGEIVKVTHSDDPSTTETNEEVVAIVGTDNDANRTFPTTMNTNSTEAAALATALKNYALNTANNVAKHNTESLGEKTPYTAPIGMYLVVETANNNKVDDPTSGPDTGVVASKPILIDLKKDDNITVNPKKDSVTLDKKTDKAGDTAATENTPGSQTGDTNNKSIGDTISYQVDSIIPTYEANVNTEKLAFSFSDTFSTGITYNSDLTVWWYDDAAGQETWKKLINVTDYDVTTPNGVTFNVALKPATILAKQGKQIKLTYTGTLNENAVIGSTGNPNTVTLTYTNNPDKDQYSETLTDEVKTYTYGFGIHKVDKATPSTSLNDAKFTVQEKDSENYVIFKETENGTYTVVKVSDKNDKTQAEAIVNEHNKTADNSDKWTLEITSKGFDENSGGAQTAAGEAKVQGLDEGTYLIEETQAPDAFTKLAEKLEVTITAKDTENDDQPDDGTWTLTGKNTKIEGQVDENNNIDTTNGTVKQVTGETGISGNTIEMNVFVEDEKGVTMPETGSRTAMYCMIGGAAVIVLGAGYYLLGARRNKKEQ